jgi:hypothetical protein
VVSSSQSRDHHIKNVQLNKQLQVAAQNLDPGTDKAGELGVLRVLISYPAPPDSPTLNRVSKESRHPIATADIATLATSVKQTEILGSLERTVKAAILQRKEKLTRGRAN